MKKLILILLPVLVFVCVMSSCDARRARLEAQKAREIFVRDSINRENFVRDSLRRRAFYVKDSIAKREKFVADSIQIVKNKKDIARLSKLYKKKYDEFSDCTWVTPYSSSNPNRQGSNTIYCYCYFATRGEVASNFRFVFQYISDNWLFIEDLIFNIDGSNYITTPTTWKHDVSGGLVAEWCDEAVEKAQKYENNINETLIKAICEGKVVKIKMNGSNHYNVITLSSAQKKSIKDTYDYYKLLGGKFSTM